MCFISIQYNPYFARISNRIYQLPEKDLADKLLHAWNKLSSNYDLHLLFEVFMMCIFNKIRRNVHVYGVNSLAVVMTII
jgi:hypothetical protein